MMKNITYIVSTICCLLLSGCGMTEPWKDWENEGTMSESRLRPSEVKSLLNEADVWKMSYQGTTFYFQFEEDGKVRSQTDKTILQGEVESSYILDFQGEKSVLLTLDDGGALQFLPNNQEKTFVISGYDASGITAKGLAFGGEMNLIPISAAELQSALEEKRQAIIAYNKAQSVILLKTTLNNGLLRDASGALIARYTLSCTDDAQWSIAWAWLEDGKVKHLDSAITLDMTSEESTILAMDQVTIQGISLSKLLYVLDSGKLITDNAAISVELNKASDWVNTYTTAWHTLVLDRDNIHEAFAGLPGQVEFDDRSPRNIVICPADGYSWWYVFFVMGASADDTQGRVYLTTSGINMMFGGSPENVEEVYRSFLDFCLSPEGLWIYSDADGYTYVISPNNDKWFRMK